MSWYGKMMKKFSKMPRRMMMTGVLGKVFGPTMDVRGLLGISMKKNNWKWVGGLIILAGTLTAVITGRQVMRMAR